MASDRPADGEDAVYINSVVSNVAVYNRAFDKAEVEALADGASAYRCPDCGKDFVIVDGRQYTFREQGSDGHHRELAIACHKCSEPADV